MYKLGQLNNNGQNEESCNGNLFVGHNMNNASCNINSPSSEPTSKSSTTSVLRRWRRPETHENKNAHSKDAQTQPKYVTETDKQMNQVGHFVGGAEISSTSNGGDYSMFVPQLSPLVPQSTARPYDKFLPHVQYGDSKQDKNGPNYYNQDNTNHEVHFRSPSYPGQNTPPLAHSSSQKCVLPNENTTYPIGTQKPARDYTYPHRDYSVVAHNFSPSKINHGESKEDSTYCLPKSGYIQDNRISPQAFNYPLQNTLDRRVSPHNPKSPIYRNYSQNNIPQQNLIPSTKEYITQNTNYYMEKSNCVTQKVQGIDPRFVNYNQNYSKTSVMNHDPKLVRDYRNVPNKKASPPFPILEQRLNQDSNYCTEFNPQGYYKYPMMFSRTSTSPKIVRDGTTHNYISPNVQYPKLPQDVPLPSNYSFPNKYYSQNPGQEWKMTKEFEPNLHLSQMNQMHARLPHKPTDIPRDLSYVDQSQRLAQKGRMYCSESSPDHLQYGKQVIPQKSPKLVNYNTSEIVNDYLNLTRSCGSVVKPTEYPRTSKPGEYGPVIQSVKAGEIGYDPKISRDYLMHQQCRSDIPNDQQNYVCSPPLMTQNSRNPSYPVGYPRQSNIKINEIPPRNISPRRTFQENMPVVVFSPQHLLKTSPNQMYPEFSSQYPGYYTNRDALYPGGIKPGLHQYPVDQSGKYPGGAINRNISQQRFGFPEQYYQSKHPETGEKINYYQGNLYRGIYNIPEHFQQTTSRQFEEDFRNEASNYADFETRSEDQSYNKKDSDIGKSLKEFLESWEEDEEIVANLPDLVLCNNIPPDKQKLPFADHSEEANEPSKLPEIETSKEENAPDSQPLYILGTTNISSEALPQYLAVYEQVDRLPDNIKGFYKESGTDTQVPESAFENLEKQIDNLEVPPDARSSLSPQDLSVNKTREDEEEVLNLSTNRNKENNEFLVEEYSNTSEENLNETEHLDLQLKSPVESNTNLDKEKKSLEKTNEIEETEIVFEKNSTDKIVNTNIEDKTDENKTDQNNDLQKIENLKDSKEADENCVIVINLGERKTSENTVEQNKPTKDSIEEQKTNVENFIEKSLTTSVIVQNTFFENKDSDRFPILTEDENNKIPKIIDNIFDNPTKTPESCEKMLLDQPPKLPENTELKQGTDDLIRDIENTEIEKENNNLDIDVIDFETTNLFPENLVTAEIEKYDNINKPEREIETADDLESMSFENLINSPENIEMKDDESISIDLELNTENIISRDSNDHSLCTPTNIDITVPEPEFNSEPNIKSSLENIVLKKNSEIEQFENSNLPISEIKKKFNSVESESFEHTDENFESVHPENTEVPSEILPNEKSDNISVNDIEKQTDTIEKDPEMSEDKSEENNEEDVIKNMLANMKKEDIDDNTCTSFPSLSPIPDYEIKEDGDLQQFEASNLENEELHQVETVNEENEKQNTELIVEEYHAENIAESTQIFESTVDKLIITNVKSIQDDSDDSIQEEIEGNEPQTLNESNQNENQISNTDSGIENVNNDQVKNKSENIETINICHATEVASIENSKNENSNFDFSYLESCTENICEKSEEKNDTLCEKKEEHIENKNLKFILDSSESDSDLSKDKVSNENLEQEIETNIKIEGKITDNTDSIVYIDNDKKKISEFETNLQNSIDDNLEKEPENVSNEIELQVSEPEIKQPSLDSEKEHTILESEVNKDLPETNISEVETEVPEKGTEISSVILETVSEQIEVNIPESIIETESENTEENIILPEDSQCVVIYGEDEQYLIIQPEEATEDIISPEEIVVQETEILLTEMSSEVEQQKEEVVIEDSEPVTEETDAAEIIICEEGLEDWVQNEEIIEENEEDKLESKPEIDENKTEILEETKQVVECEENKLLIKDQMKLIIEEFITEERKNSFPEELKKSVEEKELFINPENPDTLNNSFSYSSVKRRVSYEDFSSPKIDFKAPKRRYSSMEINRVVKKPLINLDEISNNITLVLENLTKREIKYENVKKDIKSTVECKKELENKDKIEENKSEDKKEVTTIPEKINETKCDTEIVPKNDNSVIENSSYPSDSVSELVEQLIKPKLIIPKTNYNIFNNNEEIKPNLELLIPITPRRPSLLKVQEEKKLDTSPVVNTARLTKPIFPKITKPIPKCQNVDPRIERLKEPTEKEEKPSLIKNKLCNTFGLTEYTKNFIKMKTGQTVEPKIISDINGSKKTDSRMNKIIENKIITRRKHQNVNGDCKNNEKKVKINLQDYRNRKQSQSSECVSDCSTSSSQHEEVSKKPKENKIEITEEPKSIETPEKKINVIIEKPEEEITPGRKIEKLIIKPKKSLDASKDLLLIPEDTNNEEEATNKLDSGNSKSKIDLKQPKPKKRKRRFRNLHAVDEEDEVPTKQPRNSEETNSKLGILSNEDSTCSSKISDNSSSSSKINGESSDILCCLDLNSNDTNEHDCGFKCHINLNAISEKIRDYEINKNSKNTNRLKLTLKPVQKKKPAFSDVLSNIDSIVKNELLAKRHKKKLNDNKNSVSTKNGDGTLWTINNEVPKVIIKRNGTGYCAVFRDVSSNPIWQPKIRLKRQKYIESLVLRSNVKC